MTALAQRNDVLGHSGSTMLNMLNVVEGKLTFN